MSAAGSSSSNSCETMNCSKPPSCSDPKTWADRPKTSMMANRETRRLRVCIKDSIPVRALVGFPARQPKTNRYLVGRKIPAMPCQRPGNGKAQPLREVTARSTPSRVLPGPKLVPERGRKVKEMARFLKTKPKRRDGPHKCRRARINRTCTLSEKWSELLNLD